MYSSPFFVVYIAISFVLMLASYVLQWRLNGRTGGLLNAVLWPGVDRTWVVILFIGCIYIQIHSDDTHPHKAVSVAMLMVPLAIRDKIIGVMRVYSAAPQRFTQKEINFLKAVANLGALAIENAKLYEQLKDRYEGLKQDLSEWYNFLSLG